MKEVILNNGTKIPSIGVGVFRVEDANIAYETVKTALSVGYRHEIGRASCRERVSKSV